MTLDLATLTIEITKTFAGEWALGAIPPKELLTLWWVFSQLTDESIDEAKSSLTKPPDGGVDAVLVDHDERSSTSFNRSFTSRRC
jgi:hypothetical protein